MTRDCAIRVAKTKALISCAAAQLICIFLIAYAESGFSHDVAHIKKKENHHFYSREKSPGQNLHY